jgi:putative sterol carrier protein
MPVFESAEKLYRCLGDFLELMSNHPQTRRLLQTTELTVRFVYTEPEASITLVARDGEQSVHYGDYGESPDVQLSMSGDIAHRFWMGEVNVMNAILTRQIVADGPLNKIMELKPLIKAAMEIYPRHFKEYVSPVSS